MHLIPIRAAGMELPTPALHPPERASRRWLGRPSVGVAWLGLSLALLTPPHGIGVTVCWLRAGTGLSCPGCGLTRSLSCAMRGLFVESWHHHPMGLAILALFLATAIASMLPPTHYGRLTHFIESHRKLSNGLYLAFVGTFLAFGTARALLQLKHLLFP